MKKIIPALIAILFAACGSTSNGNKHTAAEAPEADKVLVGGDADEHGCRASAGYVWSELLGDCIRIFEAGTQMVSTTDANATQAAYVVFNADESRVEVYLPGKEAVTLDRGADKGVWGDVVSKDIPAVISDGTSISIVLAGKTIYRQK